MMICAVGFGIFRLTGASRGIVITYDSDLRDKIARTETVKINSPLNDPDIENIRKKFLETENYVKDGEDEKSLNAVNDIKRQTISLAADNSNPHRIIFQNVENEIAGIEKTLHDGDDDKASREIEISLKELDDADRKR